MQETSAQQAHVHAPPEGFIRKHVFSLDHKVIGKQYYALALVAVFVGMFLSWLMRIHLVWPNSKIPGLELLSKVGAPGGVMTPEYYLSLLTMHGTLMVFFVLTNAPFAAFGNYFLPIQIGAEDMAFPRFNMMSFWTTFIAFIVLITAFFIPDGPPIAGWTSYAPLSAVGKDAGPGMQWGASLWGLSIAIFCIASLLGSLNFIATTLDLRAKGMTLMRMPISTWAWFITSCISLLAFAVLLPACILLILDRHAGTSFFIPAGLVVSDQSAATFGRFAAAVAASVLVLRTSGGVHRDSSGDGHRFAHSDQQHAQAPAQRQGRHLLDDVHRLPELHGLGASHVRERHESDVVAGVFFPHADDHHSGDGDDADLARQPLRCGHPDHFRFALRAGLHFDVCQRRR